MRLVRRLTKVNLKMAKGKTKASNTLRMVIDTKVTSKMAKEKAKV